MVQLFPDHWNCYLNKREENEICSWLKQSNRIYNEKRGSCTGSPHPIPALQMQGSHLAKLLLVPPGTLLTLSSHSLCWSLAGTFSGPIVGLPLAGTVGIMGGAFCCVRLFVYCKTDCDYSCPHPHPKWRNCRWHEESVWTSFWVGGAALQLRASAYCIHLCNSSSAIATLSVPCPHTVNCAVNGRTCTGFSLSLFSVFFGVYPGVELLGQMSDKKISHIFFSCILKYGNSFLVSYFPPDF